MSNWFMRLAVLYFVVGVLLGIMMGASGDHGLMPVHAHLNLLGWVSLMLFGMWYRTHPAAAGTTLAKVHFWIHNLSLPVLMVLLVLLLKGNAALGPVTGVVSMVLGVGVLCFAVNLWRHTAGVSGSA